jgi:hypothetical protein
VRPPSFLRRLFQFRLRTLLLAVLRSASRWGWYVRRVELQRQSIVAIQQAGGSVNYDYELVGKRTISSISKSTPTGRTSRDIWWVPESLRARLGDDYFHGIEYAGIAAGKTFDTAVLSRLADFRSCECFAWKGWTTTIWWPLRLTQLRGLVIAEASGITDEGIAELAELRKLEMIALHGPRVTDSSLAILASLPKLTTLGIARDQAAPPRIGPEGLKQLARLTRLRNLRLESQPGLIVNDDLSELREMKSLERLMLVGFDISEGGFENLERLTILKDVYLVGSNHPDTSRLKRALPGCIVVP